ncbi:polysaccharide deacetylase family protein [Paenibacillus hodogayensis]|uniref:Polysaccharide deacetylase family protein n=1 Tax=Paenibacillus hodogayensis TaxID=279208 RepID=A0ABV5W6C0_9BACL
MKLRPERAFAAVGKAGFACRWILFTILFFSLWPGVRTWADGGSPPIADSAAFAELQANHRLPDTRAYAAPESPTVYLTFDDGPSEHTGAVLDILQQEQVPATFFVLGQGVDARPELVRRIVREGHALGNHSYDHVYDNLYGSFGSFWQQVQRTERALETKADASTRLLRAPGGTYTNFDASYFYYLEQAGYAIFDWNVDSGDSKRRGVPAKEIVKGATDLSNTHKTPNQIVVLMHDGAGHGETVKALPEIIRFYKDNGYAFASLSPDVKPVQSSLGKLKWQRSENYADYAARLATSREHAAGWGGAEAHVVAETERPVTEITAEQHPEIDPNWVASSSPIPVPPPLPPFTLRLAAGTLTLDSADYRFADDRLYVPLRGLAQAMGATVEWREGSREAVIRYGLVQAVYDIPHRTVTVSAPGKPEKRLVLAEMSLSEGKLYVSPHLAVELLGGRIEEYKLGEQQSEVHRAAGPILRKNNRIGV